MKLKIERLPNWVAFLICYNFKLSSSFANKDDETDESEEHYSAYPKGAERYFFLRTSGSGFFFFEDFSILGIGLSLTALVRLSELLLIRLGIGR